MPSGEKEITILNYKISKVFNVWSCQDGISCPDKTGVYIGWIQPRGIDIYRD